MYRTAVRTHTQTVGGATRRAGRHRRARSRRSPVECASADHYSHPLTTQGWSVAHQGPYLLLSVVA